jgi:hypothetical protein
MGALLGLFATNGESQSGPHKNARDFIKENGSSGQSAFSARAIARTHAAMRASGSSA